MKKKVIIIDHDPNGVVLLKRYLSSHTLQLELRGEALNCRDGIELIREVDPDLVLLDIDLPEGSGFDIIKATEDQSFQSIVITAFDELAIPAFDADVLHFLRKPVGKEKFDLAILRFYQRHNLLEDNNKIRPAELLVEKKMKIPRLHGFDIVLVKDIVRLQANGSYTKIYFSSGETILVSKHLKTYEEGLDPLGFVRVHKSHLVNTAYIKSIRKGKKGAVVLNDDTHIYFSNIYKEEIMRHFLD